MFIGREYEVKELIGLWDKRVSSLITCRGRRRVGKSTLIEEFAKVSADHFIEIEGLAPRAGMSDVLQRKNFCKRLDEITGERRPVAESWPIAFARLDEAIPSRGRTVVLLDEISWIGGYDLDFPGYLKTAWDKRWKRHDNLIVVLCGSVSSWIAENILKSTGFVGRNSLDLEVRELPMPEALQVVGPAAERLSSLEKFDILSVVGGIPRYLEEIRPAMTFEENVRKLCFVKQGLLFREFNETFSQVFGKQMDGRRRLLEELSAGALTAAELAERLGVDVNGHLTKALEELEYAGFITRDSSLSPLTGKATRRDRYRVCDNYIRFYLTFIAPNAVAIDRGLFKFASMEQFGGWGSVLGLQFQNLILNHVDKLFPYFGLDHALVLSAAPYYQPATKRGEGCQIDLLIQTKRTLFVVEIKRKHEIDASVIEEVLTKVKRLRRNPDYSVRTALVYCGKLSKQVEAEGYFDKIVDAKDLLELRN